MMKLLVVFIVINVVNCFIIRPSGIAPGNANSWIYFGRGLNQKGIIDNISSSQKETTTTATNEVTTTTSTLSPSTTIQQTTTDEITTSFTEDLTSKGDRNAQSTTKVTSKNGETTKILVESSTKTEQISTSIPFEPSPKMKIVVIPKETKKEMISTKPIPSTEDTTTTKTIELTTDYQNLESTKSVSSSEETKSKPNLYVMLKRVYRGQQPLH